VSKPGIVAACAMSSESGADPVSISATRTAA
jgi:hypothetical protein